MYLAAPGVENVAIRAATRNTRGPRGQWLVDVSYFYIEVNHLDGVVSLANQITLSFT